MNTTPDVDAWFEALDRPVKLEMLRVREIILGADPRITESIKWKTPTFSYEGNLASFNPAKRFVSLLFHEGASIPAITRSSRATAPTPVPCASSICPRSRSAPATSRLSSERGAR